jgi:glycosyltransferase involved in cell wall biosynthesis
MRIAIDARPLSHPQAGGFKSYTHELIRALARLDEPLPSGERVDFLLYLDRYAVLEPTLHAPNITVRILGAPIPNLGVIWREQVSVPLGCRRDGAALAHFTANTSAFFLPCPAVVTLHDLIFWDERPTREGISFAEWLKRWGMFAYGRIAARRGIARARRIITVSEYSRREIIRRFHVESERCVVIHNGVSERFRRITDETQLAGVCDKYKLAKPFLLAITSASPRKNARGLLESYRALAPELQERYDLVIVWTNGLWQKQIAKQVETFGLQSRVRFVERVDDQDLVGLMNLSALFVFPSLTEGFGLPPLEAMACGTPVVASNRSSLPEILGDGALLVDPLDSVTFAQAITAVLTRPGFAAEMRARGSEWVQRYSWARCARETWQVYREAVRA